MNKTEIKDSIQDAVISSLDQKVSEGSAFWRLNEIFTEQLKNDADGLIFNDQYAEDLAEFRTKLQLEHKRWLLVGYSSIILMLSTLTGYTLPINFPYIDTITNNGLLEVSLVIFFIAQAQLVNHGLRISLLEKLLRTYVEVRYSTNEGFRDFYLLRWGIEKIVSKLHIEKYMGYTRKNTQGVIKKTISILSLLSVILFVLATLVLVPFAMVNAFLNPAFGWLTYIILVGIFLHWLQNWISALSADWRGLFVKQN